MNCTPDPPERDGMTRRHFIQGRFGPAAEQQPPVGDSSSQPRPRPRRAPLVMRYPKTLRQVGAGDANPHPQSQAEALPAAAARRRTIPILRPPGAINEESFLQGCTRCDDCRRACPHQAIVHAPERMREAAGTPMIDADLQACMMCEDFPCIAACQPDVLSSRVPPMMGTAKITEHLCLAHHGTTCTVCSERCPVPAAIHVIDGKPTVNESNCTGCGVCRYVCPAPENAVLLMPAFLRPSPPRNPASE